MAKLIEIKVGAKTPVNALGGSIVNAWNDGKDIMLTCIGPIPVATAVKAVCVANRALASKGVVLCTIPGLIERMLFDKATQANVPWVVTTMRLRNMLDSPRETEAQEIIQEVGGDDE